MVAAARPTVTRQLIAQAALKIIDRDGLSDLSLHRVAKELGIRAPSLYYHFKGRDEILRAVARLVLLDTPVLPEPPSRQWRSWLLRQCLEFRRAVLRNPRAAPLLLGYLPRQLFPAQYERTSVILDRAGVPLGLHVLIYEAIDQLTLGSAMYAAATSGDPGFFPHLSLEARPTLRTVVEGTSWSAEEVFAKALEGFLASIPSGAAAARRPSRAASGGGHSVASRLSERRRGRPSGPRNSQLDSEGQRVPATRQLIAETTLALIDTEGLNAVRMKRVANLLGIRGPTLYHHFTDKSELLEAVARLVLLEVPLIPPRVATEWREWQVQQCLGYRQVILKHLNVAPLLLGSRPRELFPNQYERVSRVLAEAGVPYRYHLVVFETTDQFTLGAAMYAASNSADTGFFPEFDAGRLPTLAKAVAANPWDSEQIFAETVRHFLAAVPDGRRRLQSGSQSPVGVDSFSR